MNVLPDNGSIYLHDYLPALSDNREIWQPTWETEVGTTVQNDMETVTKNYVTDYLSLANRDIMVKNEGQYVQRYVYGADSERVSVQVTYAKKTQRGQSGENLASDFAANDTEEVWYRHSLLDSTLIAVDKDGEQVVHMSYDAWGSPETETKLDENFAGIDNLNNFTGYTYDETLELYFAQNRFYDPKLHRFTQQDPVKDGENWYAYCDANPTVHIDFGGTTSWALKWGGSTWPLVAADGSVPAGDIVYVVGIGVCVLIDGGIALYNLARMWDTTNNIGRAPNANVEVYDYSSLPNYLTGNASQTTSIPYAAALQNPAYNPTYSCEKAKEATVSLNPKQKQNFFPASPTLFMPRGLTLQIYPGTKNGAIWQWKVNAISVFEWDENPNHADGSHYHIRALGGFHYLPGMPIPEPYNTLYF